MWYRSLGYGDLLSEYMKLGSCGSQGNVQSEMMHGAHAQERMSVFTEGGRWTRIRLGSVFLRVCECLSFKTVVLLRSRFDC